MQLQAIVLTVADQQGRFICTVVDQDIVTDVGLGAISRDIAELPRMSSKTVGMIKDGSPPKEKKSRGRAMATFFTFAYAFERESKT